MPRAEVFSTAAAIESPRAILRREGYASETDSWEQAEALGCDEWMVSEWEAEQKALLKPDDILVRA